MKKIKNQKYKINKIFKEINKIFERNNKFPLQVVAMIMFIFLPMIYLGLVFSYPVPFIEEGIFQIIASLLAKVNAILFSAFSLFMLVWIVVSIKNEERIKN